VPDSSSRYIPDGDVLFATGWHTVKSVLECPESKGEKCYLIQGYEVWQGPKELVDATWRAPLHKVVIAKWLLELGQDLGCEELAYIPNAVDHDRYRLVQPIEGRTRQVAMLFSPGRIKGSPEGFEALQIAKKKYPDLKAVFFSASRRMPSVPDWIDYYRNPPQEFIINEIYNKSRIFLAPSWTEGSPLPPAEAACCGCALVATDIGGFREYIQNGINGLLSPPKEPAQLAENLCLLLENDDLRQRIANEAHKSILHFNWEHSTDLLEHFLARVASQGLRAQPV
jgi:glycosyltransferase involved in cell wall biosynthesis